MTNGVSKRQRRVGLSVLVLSLAVYLNNASWLATPPQGKPRLLAHRGVHLDFSRVGLHSESCAASRIIPPFVGRLENTLDSMRDAFAYGADVVEIDIRKTTDRQFAVFHDHTLDCATNGTGLTSEHDLATLQALDIGYGYTPDGGKTFPYRGKGVGLMPSLNEVVAAFPDKRFLLNFKTNDPDEGELFAEHARKSPRLRKVSWGVYGGRRPTERAMALVPGLRGYTFESIRSCLLPYVLVGWSGYVPSTCHNAILILPIDYAVWMWGWPNRFLARMTAVNAEMILRAPSGRELPEGIDSAAQLSFVPQGFPGLLWTNRIQELGPVLGRAVRHEVTQ